LLEDSQEGLIHFPIALHPARKNQVEWQWTGISRVHQPQRLESSASISARLPLSLGAPDSRNRAPRYWWPLLLYQNSLIRITRQIQAT